MVQQVGEVYIVLDALDECRTRAGKRTEGMLSWMKDFLKTNSEDRNVHLLMTSRSEQDIEAELSQWVCDDDVVPIRGDDTADDIRAYIHTRIREDNGLKRWRSRPDVQDEIEAKLTAKADGM